MKKNLEPSNNLQDTVLSVGAGYFYDFDKQGAFRYLRLFIKESAADIPAYQIQAYRYVQKEYPDITDISFGFMVGIANPFIDIK
jgi:hypothetical protein